MIANTFTKYTKYTSEELESYVADSNACVQKLEWTNIVSVLPKYLGNICEGVRACLTLKIGKYDRKVDGIILAFKNTKILSPLSAIRPNGVRVHVKVSSHFYVFRPLCGATIEGTIKYVSKNYLSAVVYRVFNVTIRVRKEKLQEMKQGRVISFLVKSFDIKCDLPFIEGELISSITDEPDGQLEYAGECVIKKEKSKTIKSEPSDSEDEVTEKMKGNRIAKRESNSVPPENLNNPIPAGEDYESDTDIKYSMKHILSNLEKELSDAADSASEKNASKSKMQANSVALHKKMKVKTESVASHKKKSKLKSVTNRGALSDDEIKHSMRTILSNLEKELSDAADSASEKVVTNSRVQPDSVEGSETVKRKKDNSDNKGKLKKVKENGHALKTNTRKSTDKDMDDTINAILNNLEKEMSDVADSDYGSSKQSEFEATTSSSGTNTSRSTKHEQKSDVTIGTPKKANKRNHAILNGHSSAQNDMESSIQALLNGMQREISDVADSDRNLFVTNNSKSKTPRPTKPSSGKKKKKKLDIDSLEKQLFLKMAAEYGEKETSEPAAASSEVPHEKKKKKKKASEADDFESSIMSSILKCAALVGEDEPKSSPASSPSKKATRKSVRFDNTITEASFNAFDSSDLLEISQLRSPTLSSTLRGN
ncbi:uncharacterized protein LOC134220299 [Armigeres subalbatus]|uniref:uncharacterized protein LOC134220299 n=1 Tax=Armigeres subalbatus TaxID=124917 RepID=UPI002ED1C04C